MNRAICFLGGARYPQPLDASSEKKFRALRSLGDLYVVGFSSDVVPRSFTQEARFYLLPNLPLRFLRYVMMLTAGLLLALWCVFHHRVRAIVAQSPYEGLAAAAAKIIARGFGLRVLLVVEAHGDFEGSLFLNRRTLLPGVYRAFMRLAASIAFSQADVLRAISQSTRRQVSRWAADKRVVQFVAWTDIDAFLRCGPKADDSPQQRVLYAGVLTPEKGVHHLVDAFAAIAREFPRARLDLVGREASKGYAADLRARVKRDRLHERVRFVGEVPQEELALWMHGSSALVLPSLSEGLGRVIIEAMATGTPVIGSHVGGIPELIEDGETGFLVPPGDPAALSDQLRWILQRPREAREMGRRARRFARRVFSTEGYVESYGSLFQVNGDSKARRTGERPA